MVYTSPARPRSSRSRADPRFRLLSGGATCPTLLVYKHYVTITTRLALLV